MSWLIVALSVAGLAFGLGAVLGAPFLPVRTADQDAILDLAGAQSGQRLLDLGAGDGRMLIAAARRGLQATGYEINPLLFVWSWLRTRPYRQRVQVKLGDYWSRPLPSADIIYVFLISHHMSRLDRKLSHLTQPTKVISYIYELPRPEQARTKNAHLYIYP